MYSLGAGVTIARRVHNKFIIRAEERVSKCWLSVLYAMWRWKPFWEFQIMSRTTIGKIIWISWTASKKIKYWIFSIVIFQKIKINLIIWRNFTREKTRKFWTFLRKNLNFIIKKINQYIARSAGLEGTIQKAWGGAPTKEGFIGMNLPYIKTPMQERTNNQNFLIWLLSNEKRILERIVLCNVFQFHYII